MLTVQLGLIALVLGIVSRTGAIMVPTGKIGPISPFKPIIPQVFPNRPYVAPAPVWERIDEGDTGYQPPVYKYTILENARKFNHRTLFPRDEDYFTGLPPRKSNYYYSSKSKYYYSPLQFL